MARQLEPDARLVLASHNPGKLAELEDLLRPHGVFVVSAGALGLPEPPEDAPDFVGNARAPIVEGRQPAVFAGRIVRRLEEGRLIPPIL